MAAYYACIGCQYYDANIVNETGEGFCRQRERYFLQSDSCVCFKKGKNYYDTCFDCGYYLRYKVNRFGEGLCEKQEIHCPRDKDICECFRERR